MASEGPDKASTGMTHGHAARLSFAALVGLLVVALTAPAVALLVTWARSTEPQPTSSTTAGYRWDASARTVTVGAEIDATWRDAAVVRSPGWEGIVTQVMTSPGQAVRNGQAVARVDGVDIRVFTVQAPLYRPVCRGDRTQVSEVRSILSAAGLRTGSSRSVSASDIASIKKYAIAIGVPNGAAATCFDPRWVALSTAPLGRVAKVGMATGTPAPARGEALITGHPALSTVNIVGDTGSNQIDETLSAKGAAVFADTDLLINGRSTGISLTSLSTPESRSRLTAFMRPADQTASASAPGNQGQAAEAEKAAVLLTLRDTQFVVPATAVVNAFGNQACVVSSSGETTTIPVKIIASSISGIVIEVPGGAQGEAIQISPGDVQCG